MRARRHLLVLEKRQDLHDALVHSTGYLIHCRIPYDVQQALAATGGDRHVVTGDYKGAAHSLDYPCSSSLSPQVSAAVLRRGDLQFLRFLRLRIAEVGTNQDNLLLYCPEIRNSRRPLRETSLELHRRADR